jgi:hypothetical protein
MQERSNKGRAVKEGRVVRADLGWSRLHGDDVAARALERVGGCGGVEEGGGGGGVSVRGEE